MRVLLLSDIPPATNFTAGLVLKDLANFLLEEGHSLSCFAISDPSLHFDIPTQLKDMPYLTEKKPRESWGHSKFRAIASLVMNNKIASFELPAIAKKVAQFAKEQKADIIWSAVQGQTMIKLVRAAAKLAGLPYTVEVWDPPQWWLSENKFDKYTFNSVMDEFGNLLHNAQCCLAASWYMAEEYSKLYQAKCIPVIPALSPENVVPANKDENYFTIAFSGQIYAKAEFSCLMEALNILKWNFNGKPIKVKIYGSYFQFNFNFPCAANVEILGWCPQDQLLRELAAADLLYCPYWFSENFATVAKLSFPSKLTSYLKAKAPVLVHAPEYASASKFIKENEAGWVANFNDPNAMAKLLTEIMSSDLGAKYSQNGFDSFLRELSFPVMKKHFFQTLGIES